MVPLQNTLSTPSYVSEIWDPRYANHNVTYQFGTNVSQVIDDRITSYSTPGFRLLKRRQLPDHPHYWQQHFVRYSRGRGEQLFVYDSGRVDRNIYDCSSSAFGVLINTDTVVRCAVNDDPRNRAIAKLQSQASLTSGNAVVTIAEAHKTAKMVGDTAFKLAKAYSELKKLRLGDMAKTLGLTVTQGQIKRFRKHYRIYRNNVGNTRQFVANTWLEYSYGWKPLLSDIYAQSENLARVLTDKQYVIREIRSRAFTEGVGTFSTTSGDGLWKTNYRGVVRDGASYTLRYKIQNGADSVANTFGLLNPLEVAWELIPFSFVVDWFLPIGNFLSSLTAWNGLEFAGGTLTQTRRATIAATLTAGPGSRGSGVTYKCGSIVGGGYGEFLGKTRSLLTSFPTQSLPSLKDPRSFLHAASAISLLQSVFLGSSNSRGVLRL